MIGPARWVNKQRAEAYRTAASANGIVRAYIAATDETNQNNRIIIAQWIDTAGTGTQAQTIKSRTMTTTILEAAPDNVRDMDIAEARAESCGDYVNIIWSTYTPSTEAVAKHTCLLMDVHAPKKWRSQYFTPMRPDPTQMLESLRTERLPIQNQN